jgi:hypothetical protein
MPNNKHVLTHFVTLVLPEKGQEDNCLKWPSMTGCLRHMEPPLTIASAVGTFASFDHYPCYCPTAILHFQCSRSAAASLVTAAACFISLIVPFTPYKTVSMHVRTRSLCPLFRTSYPWGESRPPGRPPGPAAARRPVTSP